MSSGRGSVVVVVLKGILFQVLRIRCSEFYCKHNSRKNKKNHSKPSDAFAEASISGCAHFFRHSKHVRYASSNVYIFAPDNDKGAQTKDARSAGYGPSRVQLNHHLPLCPYALNPKRFIRRVIHPSPSSCTSFAVVDVVNVLF